MKKLLKVMSMLLCCFVLTFSFSSTTQAASTLSSKGLRGVSVPSIWYDSQSYSALDSIKNETFNTVRIVWNTSGSPSRLDQIISKCVSLNLKPIVELHDATGGTDTSSLNTCVNYWIRSDVKSVLSKYNTLWVNIANEWGPANSTTWRDGYISAINTIRSAGITNGLVVDAGGWGQDGQDILNYASAVMNGNSNKNIMFSIHMYGSWNNDSDIDSFLTSCQSKGIPIMVGEFGYNYNSGNNNLSCKVDAAHLMKECNKLGIGYLAWSWCGNDSSNSWLDLTSNWGSLTNWGNLVVSTMWS